MAQMANRDPDSILFNWSAKRAVMKQQLVWNNPLGRKHQSGQMICTTELPVLDLRPFTLWIHF